MLVADLLGMRCWIDNCADQMNLGGDWLEWVELASKFVAVDLLMTVLDTVPTDSRLSAMDICEKLQDAKLLHAALTFFDTVRRTVLCSALQVHSLLNLL